MKKLNLLFTALVATSIMGMTACDDTSTTTIGILQIATHDALDACKTGFINELAAEGFVDGENVEINFQNPEGDSAVQDSMATNLAINSDMVFGISTSSALALKNSVEDLGKETPVLFSAVTDPVSAGLVTSFTDHANVVGTSDGGPTADNIDLFTEFDGIDKIGIMYNQAEPNSVIQKDEAQAECDAKNITLVDGGVTAATDIDSTLQNLIGQGIKGLFVPTDNAIAAAMSSMKEVLEANDIVTVCADNLVTANGGSLGFSVDYEILGETTGKMASKILNGEDITTIACSKSETFPLAIRDDFFTTTEIAIPQAIQDILDSQGE